ncbi:hypothetical protein IMSAGC019_00979 [Lachnospiraceae bacterium]|nr:hypothetical protein IMSAGC019_00979 [Lachnospiraceae bacterium]
MKNVNAVFQKQIKDTLKNKEIFIQFVLFPVMAAVMKNMVKVEGMPENYFVNLFAAMYTGMAPLVAMAAVIAEEKEKNTLRVLMMSGVKPWEYLLGAGSYIWAACMLGAFAFGLLGEYQKGALGAFVLVMGTGILVSVFLGAAIGTISRGQMMATSLTVPVMLVLSFLPMIASFNEKVSAAAKFIYSQQISLLLGKVGSLHLGFENIFIIGANMAAALLVFGYAYKKCGLA